MSNETQDTSSIDNTLDQRSKTYGTFEDNARVAQELKAVVHKTLMKRGIGDFVELTISSDQLEALQMICSKLARIVNGDPNHIDSWHDIAGYAQLVADRLRGVVR